MNEEEKKYQEELKAQGIDIPTEEVIEEEEETEEEDEKSNPEDDTTDSTETEEETEEEDGTLKTKQKERKRSIYDEYKTKKSELKEETARREKAEAEAEELRQKLQAKEEATTPQEKQDAQDEIDAFAEKIGADPAAMRELQKLILKGVKMPELDEETKKDLAELKAFKQQNSEAMEKQAFEKEYNSVLPQIKKDFPTANDKELDAIRQKIDEVAHSKEYHDKDLDYVVYKNKEVLSALVSPKKKGLESKEKADTTEDNFSFDPNADIEKLSPANQEKWWEEYRKAGRSSGLSEDSQGRKIIV